MVKYIFITPCCPANKLELYSTIILSTHVSGIARMAVFFSGVILNNKESRRMYHSLKASTFLTAAL